MSTKTQSMGILLQYHILTPRYNFQEPQETKAGLKNLLHLSGGKEENKVAMAQYLSKYLFEKYEDEAIIAAYKCGLPVSTSMQP